MTDPRHAKGEQTEKEALKILDRIGKADRKNGKGDLFEYADLVGISRDGRVRLVQVKTNNFHRKWHYKKLSQEIDGCV